ncbi:MAG: hypothetical protein JNM62_04555 [Flavobacteriales bacterium]|nr:hypothetical protein [Flavobacteriales bacterium]
MGHRFKITALLTGGGPPDTLVEHLASRRGHVELAKYVADLCYDSLVSRAYRLDPEIFVSCTGDGVDTLFIRTGGGTFGLALLMNEGDLDGDGRDEIGYVLDHADWSNTNTYIVMSFDGYEWTELFRFAIWDWQLSELPGADREFGLIGQTDRVIYAAAVDSVAVVDLVLPVKPGVVNVVGNIGDATLDTLRVTFTRSLELKR